MNLLLFASVPFSDFACIYINTTNPTGSKTSSCICALSPLVHSCFVLFVSLVRMTIGQEDLVIHSSSSSQNGEISKENKKFSTVTAEDKRVEHSNCQS